MKVNLSAVLKRVNRQLKPQLQQLRKSRGERRKLELGEVYLYDYSGNRLLQKDVDVERFAHELGVIRADEQVVADEARAR